MTPHVANIHGNHYTSTYFILSGLSDRLIFRISLSSGLIFKKKPSTCHSTLLRIALGVFTYSLNRGLKVNVWSVIDNGLSHLGGYMIVKAVSESLQELVSASSSSMLVTLNNV